MSKLKQFYNSNQIFFPVIFFKKTNLRSFPFDHKFESIVNASDVLTKLIYNLFEDKKYKSLNIFFHLFWFRSSFY